MSYDLAILLALSRHPNRHVYAGTVSHAERLRRRAANKRARAARRAGRR